ncbi:ATP-dependent DNA helicase RecG [Cohaesibacter celericrescens]|uniref:ATP-dependent DNA helicase RecG n=1 Tax=Cohaesibacter celericrescens TaxID=2067669 RepID=A0A2N5XT95_9HYPH|nr:ATP-dependent DNA helicase RecG [Cohaesibacter celericrescens]PLW77746.1 ATP-dependent DNA helicase RecG [Cohaesibacter celericrescens]
MRPNHLNSYFSSLLSLKGVGPKLAQAFARLLRGDVLLEARRIDLLLHMPVSIIDRSLQSSLASAPEGAIVTVCVTIDKHLPPPRGNHRVPYRILAHDESDELTLTFFHAKGGYLAAQMPIGEVRYVSGRMERFQGAPQITHPDYMVDEDDFATMPLIEPVYPLTAGLSGKVLQKNLQACFDGLDVLPEWQDRALLDREGWASFNEALRLLHSPLGLSDLDINAPARQRLAYDECLASQLALSLVRNTVKKTKGIARNWDGKLKASLLNALPFTLTNSQLGAIADVEADLALPERMLRLVQGDVGSGKTMVALVAAADVIASGSQAAMMAPTDLLARQHFQSVKNLCEKVGIRAGILTGKDTAANKRATLAALEAGDIDFLIGTHALFQQSVVFADLGLAIVDEQHRFGVHQRLTLSSKGAATDLLVMTATPIPRTLVLTHYGDMDVSLLTEKPAGRKPIETRTMSLDRLGELVSRLETALVQGAKCYWVCPLVEESELLDVMSAEDRFASLKPMFGNRVELIHGRMTADEKKSAMDNFKDGDAQILVATTVIEVGVDVPAATIMVIEHAERFGLAQLHQLRGRVGRGDKASSCILLFKGPLGQIARERLNMMRETEDGFVIAEADLRLRGEGDVLGTKQSGMPGFRIADAEAHKDLMEIARKEARLIVENDPTLQGNRGAALRDLLYLFGRDEAIRLLKAG